MKDKDKGKLIIPPPSGINGIGMYPMPIITDPVGSYTGRPVDPEEKPVQDADDL